MMNDEELIGKLYTDMYVAMIKKDGSELGRILSGQFRLHHMTGMVQSKEQYIAAILEGTLNYYSVKHEHIDIVLHGDNADIVGDSRVEAAVFGGGRNTWRLRQKMKLHKENGVWLFDESYASVF